MENQQLPKQILQEIIDWFMQGRAMGVIPIRWHLFESHLKEDLPKFVPDLHQWMQSATIGWCTKGLEVVWLEGLRLPVTRVQHISGKIGLLLHKFRCEFGSLVDLERYPLDRRHKLTLLEVCENRWCRVCASFFDNLKLVTGNIFDRGNLIGVNINDLDYEAEVLWRNTHSLDQPITILLDPALLECLSLTNLCACSTDNFCEFRDFQTIQ